MIKICVANNIDETHQHIVLGRPEVEIHTMAEDLGVRVYTIGFGRYAKRDLLGRAIELEFDSLKMIART